MIWPKIVLKNNFLGNSFHENSLTFLFPPANSVTTATNSSLKLSPAEKLHAFNNSIASQMVPQGMNLSAIYTVNEKGNLEIEWRSKPA